MYFSSYLGAFYFWIYLIILNKIRNKKIPTFSDIRQGKGRYNEGDVMDMTAYQLQLKIIGFVITMLILHITIKSGI